jgi:hypothetical protein
VYKSEHEIGPFLPVEQAMLSQLVSKNSACFRNLTSQVRLQQSGRLLVAGLHTAAKQRRKPLDSYRYILLGYALIGGLLALVYRAFEGVRG